MVVVSLVLALLPAAVFAHTAEAPYVTDLIANGGDPASATDVGDVLVWNDANYLYVKYVTDGDSCTTQTHVAVATSPGGIPQSKGNPIPGHFAYQGVHDCVADVQYQIPLTWGPGASLSIAAHAVVQTGGMDGLEASLPDQVTIAFTHPGLGFGAPSYFDILVSGGTTLDGMYDGYCLDTDGGPFSGTSNVFSSYEPLPQEVRIEYRQNMDLVNWIINQGYVGRTSGCGGNYTYGDVQWAIWQLVEDNPPADHVSLGTWSLCRAQEILAEALANGEGFVPGCGNVLGLVLISPQWWFQSILIWVPVPCAQAETAWGDGLPFPGRNWATYILYQVQ